MNNEKKEKKEDGLKYINHNPQTWPFELVDINFCFPMGPLRWLTAAEHETIDWTEFVCYWKVQ